MTQQRYLLLVRPQCRLNESLRGYVSRVSTSNGDSPLLRPELESLRATTEAIDKVARLTDSDAQTLLRRGSLATVEQNEIHGVVFGSAVLSTNQVWMQRRMVCPMCLSEKDVSHCCWEMRDYDVCHLHGIYMAGHCRSCNQPLSWTSTSATACRCGIQLADIQTSVAPRPRKELCRLLALATAKTLVQSKRWDVLADSLTPLNWFLLLDSFVRSVLIPGFFLEYRVPTTVLPKAAREKLMVRIMGDQKYFRYLRRLTFLHAAGNPMTMAQTLRTGNSAQEMNEYFSPCLKNVKYHPNFFRLEAAQEKWYQRLSKRINEAGSDSENPSVDRDSSDIPP